MARKRKISNETRLNLLETLTKYSKICLVEILKMSVIEIERKLIRGEMNGKCRLSLEEKRAKLRQSAEMMVSEYKTNKDLTALASLDSEDFLDA
jgi:hypothetical protein